MAGTVVIVDDDDAVRDAIVDVLAANGYATLTAGDGHEAIAVLRAAARPCVAIVDLVMPRADGWGLIAAMGSDPSLCDVPIICATAGREQPPDGCHTVLRKPFDEAGLTAALRDAFATLR